ncbi:MAG: hypothetical protein WDM91_22350 [Rhizomicrobium sp.]
MKIAPVAFFAALAFIPAAADADPRQDLLDGMAKCAAVAAADSRLACYDALNPALKAAQAEPPPPAAVAPPPPSAPPPAPAAPPAVADNRPWYDPGRIFGVNPNEQTTPQQFGSENLAPPAPPPGTPATAQNTPPPPLESITAGLSDYSFNAHEKFIVILDDGQIWQQIESDGGKAHFKSGRNVVTIERGFMGSYNLTINKLPAIYKVKRLK